MQLKLVVMCIGLYSYFFLFQPCFKFFNFLDWGSGTLVPLWYWYVHKTVHSCYIVTIIQYRFYL